MDYFSVELLEKFLKQWLKELLQEPLQVFMEKFMHLQLEEFLKILLVEVGKNPCRNL